MRRRLSEEVEPPAFGTYGRLDYDNIADRLLCHVCGGWYRNLAQHVRLTHGWTADDYREYAGLNRQTRLITPTMRARLREQSLPLIERLRAEGKLKRWNEDPEKWRRDKAAAVETIHQGLRSEASRHRRDSWSEEDRQARSEVRRQRNLAGLDKATPEAIGEGLKRFYREHPEAVDRDRLRRIAQGRQIGEKTAREAACPHCGQTFRAASHRDKYCPTCRPAVEREYQRLWKARWWERQRSGDSSTGEGAAVYWFCWDAFLTAARGPAVAWWPACCYTTNRLNYWWCI